MSGEQIDKLVQDVREALADGKLTVFEILRIIGDLVSVVNGFLRNQSS